MTVTMMIVMLNIKTTTITPPMITAALSAVESSAWSSVPVEIMMNWLIYISAVFFYNGKLFALRGMKEQAGLRFKQLV